METGLGSAERDAEHLGDRSGRQPEVVVQHEESTLVDTQAAKPALELVAIGDQVRSN